MQLCLYVSCVVAFQCKPTALRWTPLLMAVCNIQRAYSLNVNLRQWPAYRYIKIPEITIIYYRKLVIINNIKMRLLAGQFRHVKIHTFFSLLPFYFSNFYLLINLKFKRYTLIINFSAFHCHHQKYNTSYINQVIAIQTLWKITMAGLPCGGFTPHYPTI